MSWKVTKEKFSKELKESDKIEKKIWTHYASSTLVPHSHPKRSPLSTTNSSSFLDSEFRYALSPPIYG
uniref:Uncharacterized protein n=1 Tax=Knipowitschia caucasica TaxID=637954 RepID=A0AAV2K0C1_KNICA